MNLQFPNGDLRVGSRPTPAQRFRHFSQSGQGFLEGIEDGIQLRILARPDVYRRPAGLFKSASPAVLHRRIPPSGGTRLFHAVNACGKK